MTSFVYLHEKSKTTFASRSVYYKPIACCVSPVPSRAAKRIVTTRSNWWAIRISVTIQIAHQFDLVVTIRFAAAENLLRRQKENECFSSVIGMSRVKSDSERNATNTMFAKSAVKKKKLWPLFLSRGGITFHRPCSSYMTIFVQTKSFENAISPNSSVLSRIV